MIIFETLERRDRGEHTFAAYSCRGGPGSDFVAVLVEIVRHLYVETEHLRGVLQRALSDAGPMTGSDSIEHAIDRLLVAVVPEPGTHPVPQLDMARNELAEALAFVALPQIHGTVIPAPRIRNKEIAEAPSRGLDLIGLEESPLAAIVGEVKASDENVSPPAVVGAGETSLRGQFLSFLGKKDRLLAELNWALKHAPPEHQLLIAKAILAHVNGNLLVVAAPVLVRPSERRGSDDFGAFEANPIEFAPARVRFSLLTVDRPLDELARAVYEGARR